MLNPKAPKNSAADSQTELTTAYMHDSRDHRKLKSRKDRKVRKRDRLHSDRRTDGCQRADQTLRYFQLNFFCGDQSRHLDLGLSGEFAGEHLA